MKWLKKCTEMVWTSKKNVKGENGIEKGFPNWGTRTFGGTRWGFNGVRRCLINTEGVVIAHSFVFSA